MNQNINPDKIVNIVTLVCEVPKKYEKDSVNIVVSRQQGFIECGCEYITQKDVIIPQYCSLTNKQCGYSTKNGLNSRG